MRHIIIAIGMTIATMAAVSPAEARNTGFYVFSDGDFVFAQGTNNMDGFDAGFGYDFSRHTAVEVSYIRMYGQGQTSDTGAADFVMRAPLTSSGNTALFATVGGEYGTGFGRKNIGGRFGAGVEVGLLYNITLRMGARYRTDLEPGLTVDGGLAYKF